MLTEMLRANTQPLHRQLERSYPFCMLLSPQLTKIDYFSALSILLNWHRQFEPVLAHFQNRYERLGFDRYRPLASTLSKEFLENAIDEDAFSSRFSLKSRYTDMQIEEAIALIYVIHGSALGAKMVLKAISKVNQYRGISHSPHYYTALAALAKSWSRCIDWINQMGEDPEIDTWVVAEFAKGIFQSLIDDCASLSAQPPVLSSSGSSGRATG